MIESVRYFFSDPTMFVPGSMAILSLALDAVIGGLSRWSRK